MIPIARSHQLLETIVFRSKCKVILILLAIDETRTLEKDLFLNYLHAKYATASQKVDAQTQSSKNVLYQV